ncbi:hypothetical protein M407DRAFT_6134 [Tulasnella calospora MUT 4182]|uniref:F-box domain-containing protein n=1 Tax=Tulasnella calospora MUT 4182 TaxID=1051891 RepID=A0A0C3M7D9_9AGAM|nr:hypothetical protein M407DRAFT_6134 [Tulasnella calospora MUT 4182]
MDQACDHIKRVLGEDPKAGAKLRDEQSADSDANIHLAPIQLLPHELLLTIFKLCVSEDTPVRDITPLTLVCKIWRNIAEGAPGLWGQVSGKEALPSVLKAVAMAKDAPSRKSDIPIAALEEAAVPNLRSFRFRVPWGQGWEGGAEVTLFRGEPAPPTLKDSCVESIPVIVEPLNLSGLRSLDLKEMPIMSTEEVLRVLRHSPALECCHLDSLVVLEDFEFSESDQELLRLEGVQTPTTQLSRLQSLSICGPPMTFVHPLLSVIQAPSLRWLSKTLTIELNGPAVEYSQMDETLEWIFSHIGRHRKALPASQSFFGLDIKSEWLTRLASTLKVTQLIFRTHPTNYLHIVSLLSQPLVPASDQWLLPDLKT